MKIYLVIAQEQEDPYYVLGIYSSEEKARTDWDKQLSNQKMPVVLEEYELDAKTVFEEGGFLSWKLGLSKEWDTKKC
jgi:hypothetical protein